MKMGYYVFKNCIRRGFLAIGNKVKTILSPTLFLVVVDWVMRKATQDRTGLHWNLFTQLEDLEFADDICLKE
jgi:hypothetical protein